ncbi:MAG: hypothetical protein WKG06_27455 [Segetibacter sp.]
MTLRNGCWLPAEKIVCTMPPGQAILLDDPQNNVEKIEDQFLHTQFLALVDKNGNVRGGVYDALKKDEMEKA